MTGAAGFLGWSLVFAGVAAMVCCALAALRVSAVVDRLHLLSVTTSLGAPLIGLGLALHEGIAEASAMVALITIVVLVSAPVMSAATARLTAQHAGVVDADSPP